MDHHVARILSLSFGASLLGQADPLDIYRRSCINIQGSSRTMKKDFLTIRDFTREEILGTFKLA